MQNPTAYIIPILLIGLAIFMRIRRAIGFQKFYLHRPLIRIVLFTLVLAIVFNNAIRFHPATLIYDAGGLLVGLALGYLAVRHAKYEKRNDGVYFKTHIWIEIGVLALFLARLAYRFFEITSLLGSAPPEQIAGQLRYEKDPVTGFIISIFAAYYVFYFVNVSSHAKKLLKDNGQQ